MIKAIANLFYKEKYDAIIPIGSFCVTAVNLRRFKLRKYSLPFDWLAGLEIDLILKLLESNFDDFLNVENLELFQKSEGHDIYINKLNNIKFFHDFLSGENLKDFDEVKEKFNRRIERLYNVINEAENVLFVHSTMHGITTQKCLEVYEKLQNIFKGKNINLLFLNLSKDFKQLECYNVFENVLLFDTPYDQSKNDIEGDYKTFKQILKKYGLNNSKKN